MVRITDEMLTEEGKKVLKENGFSEYLKILAFQPKEPGLVNERTDDMIGVEKAIEFFNFIDFRGRAIPLQIFMNKYKMLRLTVIGLCSGKLSVEEALDTLVKDVDEVPSLPVFSGDTPTEDVDETK